MMNSRRRPLLLSTLVLALACAPSRGAADPLAVTPGGGEFNAHSPASAQDTARIVVSGTGSVRVPADRASIRLAVETEALTASAASSANAEIAQAILDAVRPHLSGDDRVETSGYQVTPMYERDPETRSTRITGYRVQNAVVAVLTDLDDVGPVLDAALAAGANRVDDLSFFASDLGSAREEALQQAVEQARSQARATAAALGVPLGAILDVRTNTSTPGGLQTMMLQVAEGRSASTPIEAGSNVVNANVTITWALGGAGGR